ncbi:two-component sensor histidine kinase [Thalassomonas viridans]|uniref:histidine kinase n=1 Tax=Thalassomonas viridans TaxID=137584 RepID=A0AAE9Z698_9GAMM|nr:ATP-binding protein [Thalassomonas viridans]WDE06815.1 two-component sensor histidine kinase [Thalassomonas viridans]
MTQNSIKDRLVRSVSIIISVILVAILLMTDLSVDGLMEAQFNKILLHEANSLITLVEEEPEGVDFMFADEFRPEFSSRTDTEYFQLWRNNRTFEKSRLLSFYKINQLPKTELPVNTHVFMDIRLPDGQAGREVLIHFMPQLDMDERIRRKLARLDDSERSSMYLALAVSTEELDKILILVDIAFLLACIFAVVVVRYLVGKMITRGLTPLNELNRQLKNIDIRSSGNQLQMVNPPAELVPMVNELNRFIEQNTRLYRNEQRLTSDIAHELKTPITELINLTEVAIKFPHEKELSETFQPDVLALSERLKNIVNNILLWHKSQSTPSGCYKQDLQQISCLSSVKAVLAGLSCKYPGCEQRVAFTGEFLQAVITSNVFAFETIMKNLLDNALFYSSAYTRVSVEIKPTVEGKTCLALTNELTEPVSGEALNHFFEPLWQLDSARTATDHFGLGLVIVKSFCLHINASITVELCTLEENKPGITFALEL